MVLLGTLHLSHRLWSGWRGRRILQAEGRWRKALLGLRVVHVVVVQTAVLDAAAGWVGEVVVIAKILSGEVLVMGWRWRKSVQWISIPESVNEMLLMVIKIGHVVGFHAGRKPEGSLMVVTSEIGSIWWVGAVEVLWVPVESDGVGREAESGVDHARRKSSHPRSPCIGW